MEEEEKDEGEDDEEDKLHGRPTDRCYAAKFGTGHQVYKDYDCMLNQTNIANNNNKYYVIQILTNGSSYYVWNRWGRVGEDGAMRRFGPFGFDQAEKQFCKKFKDKTRNDWYDRANFKPKTGKYTLIKMQAQVKKSPAKKPAKKPVKKTTKPKVKSNLHKKVQDLIEYIYFEATGQLKKTLDCNITESGIETPLGVLSEAQVDKGFNSLKTAFDTFKKSGSGSALLSNKYYTEVPHKFGRQRPPVLNSLVMFEKEFQLLELMKDMVSISEKSKDSEEGSVLASNDVDTQYGSLSNKIDYLAPGSDEYKEVANEVANSIKRSHSKDCLDIVNIYSVERKEERKRWKSRKGVKTNHRMLYHGSRIANWVGLLSRGILMPKVVVNLGIHRTDGGWLGSGIYFGEADTASYYAGKGHKKTSFMLVCNVALGKMKDYSKITYGLSEPPKGFDSCHGVKGSQFHDDEYVVYKDNQQYMAYLVELKRKGGSGYVS
uniref:Poly [ADP-ribose] polymerase n=1 Tax=Amorphochlora amoebiformis TaxID=1561963 RepID=A0A7S0D2V7_9EUKA